MSISECRMPNVSKAVDCCRRLSAVTVASLMVFACLPAMGQAASAASPISETEIAALRQELSQGTRSSSRADARRVYKRVVRQAEALLEASPDAPNRFAVLGVILDGQKRLLPLGNTQEQRDALFATANALLKAPDAFAEDRLGADLLLMEKSLGERNATVAERSENLLKLLTSYRGSPAEWKSLVIGSMIATRLVDFDAVTYIEDRIRERFGADHEAIQYQRDKDKAHRSDAVFSGTYETAGGDSVSLPFDRWGHQAVVCFWSQKTEGIDDVLKEIKALQDGHPARFEVLSFNVDELPDAGQKKLRSLGLDATALHLPGGRESSAYRAYAQTDPCVMLVNAQGHVLLPATPGKGNLGHIGWILDDERYLAQFRYLFIGDFLVANAPESKTIPTQVIQPIQACFVPVPFRYRVSRRDALANYREAEKLCAAAIKQYADAEDAWMLRNRRIIALIGMWNLSGDSKHLDAAVKEAETVLASELPPGADAVARFCRVKAAMREGGAPERLIAGLLAACGGGKALTPERSAHGAGQAPASALAAAVTLALEGNAQSAHEIYRARLLALGDGIDESLWPVRAFLQDRLHRHRLFWASPGGLEYDKRVSKYGYRQAVGRLDEPLPRNTRVTFELKKPDGGKLTLPKDRRGRILGVVFTEPSADGTGESKGLGMAKRFASAFREQGADAVIALLTGDMSVVKAIAQGAGDLPVTMLPGGLKDPLVRKLGIIGSDRRVPHTLLFRPDGSVAWQASGLDYRYAEHQGPDLPISYAISHNIEKVRCDVGFEALERGDYKTALKEFDAYKSPHEQKGGRGKSLDFWRDDRLHGKALAYMGLKDWDAALVEIDRAVAGRNRGARGGMCKCHGMVEMYLTKATILDELGRGAEAEAERTKAKNEKLPHAKWAAGEAFRLGVPVGVYYDWLKEIRLGLEGAAGE